MRKTSWIVFSTALILGLSSVVLSAPALEPEVIYHNGKFITVNEDFDIVALLGCLHKCGIRRELCLAKLHQLLLNQPQKCQKLHSGKPLLAFCSAAMKPTPSRFNRKDQMRAKKTLNKYQNPVIRCYSPLDIY